MKKNYSVKEASKLMGVSTNTLYKYLLSGKIKSRRVGKGRFKIPAGELLPYFDSADNTSKDLNDGSSLTPENILEKGTSTLKDDDISSGASFESDDSFSNQNTSEVKQEVGNIETASLPKSDIISNLNDIVFYRLFKSVTMFGLGIIYLLSSSKLLNFELNFTNLTSDGGIINILFLALVISGILNFINVVKPDKSERYHLAIDAFTLLTLSYYALITLRLGEYGLFVFALGFGGVDLGHWISGLKNTEPNNFFVTFSRYSLYLSLLSGLVMVFDTNFIPLNNISKYIEINRSQLVFIWYLFTSFPLTYFLSAYGSKSVFKLPFFVFMSTVAIIVAINFTFIARWDVSYLSFVTGIFGFFVAWWVDDNRSIPSKNMWIITLVFFWISTTLIMGLYALNVLRRQIRDNVSKSLESTLDKIVENINNDFNQKSSVVTLFAGKESTVEALKKGSKDETAAISREIYDKLDGVERVIIFDINGIVVGVYPRNTLFEGTNFSSRSYFQETVKLYRPYISGIFEDVLGNPAIMQTEPVFSDNNLVGVIGISYDLKNFTNDMSIPMVFDYQIEASDRQGIYVSADNTSLIGTKTNEKLSLPTESNDVITSQREAEIPEWKISVKSKISPYVSKTSNLNVTLLLLLIVNALFSVMAGVIVSSKKIPNTNDRDPVLYQNPRFI